MRKKKVEYSVAFANRAAQMARWCARVLKTVDLKTKNRYDNVSVCNVERRLNYKTIDRLKLNYVCIYALTRIRHVAERFGGGLGAKGPQKSVKELLVWH